MALGCITNTVYTLHNSVHRRVITNRTVRTIKVVIYRTRQTNTTIIELLGKNHRSRQRAITANNYQCINAFLHKIVVCLLASFYRCKAF